MISYAAFLTFSDNSIKSESENSGCYPRDVNIYILGEHGDTQFPVWSHGNIGGLKISEWLNQHPEFNE
jgi:malate/lactate dehydrogenase